MTRASPRWRRVAVVGASGTGKTQLAQVVARRTGTTCVSLDDLRWTGGRTASDGDFASTLATRTTGPSWVIEGADDSPAVRDAWRHADLVVWLDHSALGVLVRMFVGTAWLREFGSNREQTRRAYAAYLLGKARRSRQQATHLRRVLPPVLDALRNEDVDVVRLPSVRSTRRWLRTVRCEGPHSP